MSKKNKFISIRKTLLVRKVMALTLFTFSFESQALNFADYKQAVQHLYRGGGLPVITRGDCRIITGRFCRDSRSLFQWQG